MSFKKKGSLSLSINAIVVLVLAISMLGLGLGFTKSMFAKFGSKLDVPPPNIPATEEEPIVTVSDEYSIKTNKADVLTLNAYNAAQTAVFHPELDCTSFTAPVKGADQKIEAGTYKSFKLIINTGVMPTDITTTPIEVCTLGLYTGTVTDPVTTKQVTINWQ
jgi:hypothetical protein